MGIRIWKRKPRSVSTISSFSSRRNNNTRYHQFTFLFNFLSLSLSHPKPSFSFLLKIKRKRESTNRFFSSVQRKNFYISSGREYDASLLARRSHRWPLVRYPRLSLSPSFASAISLRSSARGIPRGREYSLWMTRSPKMTGTRGFEAGGRRGPPISRPHLTQTFGRPAPLPSPPSFFPLPSACQYAYLSTHAAFN